MRELPPPEASSDKGLFYALSAVAWLGFVLLLTAAVNSPDNAGLKFVFAIGCAIAGSKFYQAAGNADETEAKNTVYRAQVFQAEAQAQKAVRARRVFESEADLEAELNQIRVFVKCCVRENSQAAIL